MQATSSPSEIIANKLFTIADKIRKAETVYYEAVHELNILKLDIEMREVELFKSGKVDGKNELTGKFRFSRKPKCFYVRNSIWKRRYTS